jgi:sec-independent protein translocase protein TatA
MVLGLGTQELVVILVIVVLLFGATAIPKLARGLGRAKGEFSKAKEEFSREAAEAERSAAQAPSEESVRKTARDLGIDEQGRDLADVKRLIQERLA